MNTSLNGPMSTYVKLEEKDCNSKNMFSNNSTRKLCNFTPKNSKLKESC